jgi:hypothetical protein
MVVSCTIRCREIKAQRRKKEKTAVRGRRRRGMCESIATGVAQGTTWDSGNEENKTKRTDLSPVKGCFLGDGLMIDSPGSLKKVNIDTSSSLTQNWASILSGDGDVCSRSCVHQYYSSIVVWGRCAPME